MKFSNRSMRSLVPVFLTLLVLFELVAYTTTTPRPTEQFLQFYVLGSTGKAGNYYPANSSSLQIGEDVSWNLGVVNNMGSVQYVSVRVKLGNQTILPPNDTLAVPSPAPLVTQFSRFILDNETWQFPFEWQIANYTTGPEGQVRIAELMINNVTYTLQDPPTCAAIGSCNFRLLFELWTWSVDIQDFQIGWGTGDKRSIAWLQLWFNVIPGTIHR